MNRKWFGRLAALLGVLACGLAAGRVQAQGVSARVEGVVTDTTGATVPGAAVVATNKGTNAARQAITDSEGRFLITPLQPGKYTLRVELSGFKTRRTDIALSVNQVARVDFRMEVGGLEEVVEVTGAAPLIEKTTSSLGTVIDAKQVENLPLNGRNFTQLITLAPGVNRGVPSGQASGQSGQTETFRYGEVGGGAVSANGVREQGNAYYYDGIDNNERLVNSLVFFPSPDALQEFRTITANAPAEFGRAGGAITNLISKSGSNLLHGSAYWFKRPESTAATPTFAPDITGDGQPDKPDFNRDQFGATLGGPIIKDKTFFFLNYAGLRQTIPVEVGNQVTVPTARMRNGDFSELLNPGFTGLGGPVTIYDPLTGQPFPGNIIPGNRINPVAQRYLNLFPLPENTSRLTRNYDVHRQNEGNFNDFDARIDHKISNSDTLFLRGSYSKSEKFDPGRIPDYQAGFGSGTAEAKAWSAALGWNRVFSSNVVNEFRAGHVNYEYAFLPVNFGTNQNSAIGIPGLGGVSSDNGISLVGGGDGRYIEYLGDFGQYIVTQKIYQVSDSLSWIKDRHSFKFGGTFLIADLDSERQEAGKGFYFFSDFVATPGNRPALGYTGYEVSDMLAGVTSGTGAGADPNYTPAATRNYEISLFAQDDWRVSPKLTLNLGLRWDIYTPYFEKNDRMFNLDPVLDANGRVVGGTAVLPGQNGVPRATVNTDMNNFGPRVGFAYQVMDRTVIRGSYGLFYTQDRGGIDNQLTENVRTVAYREFNTNSTTGPAHVRLSDPVPVAPARDPADPLSSGTVRYMPLDTKTPRYSQFNIGVEREFTKGMAISLFYVGTRGNDLLAQTSEANNVRTLSSVAASWYDSAQVSVRRSGADFSFLASYTFGHALNDSPGPFPAPNASAVPTIQDDLGVDKGNADYDLRHRFTFAATYALPFARDNAILGGWALNSIVTLQTGNYFSTYADNTRADLVSGQDPNSGPKTSDQWFNTAAFASPSSPYDRSGRNIVVGPGLKTIDLSLFKTFKLKGRSAVELRIESFNLLNTPQYATPNQFVGDANFGRITQTRQNSERQFQFAARFTF